MTAWILLDPSVAFGYHAPEARLITETAIVLTGLGVVALSLSRFMAAGLPVDGGIALAFLALLVPNVGQGLVLPATGNDQASWEDAGIYVWTFSRLVGLVTLLVAATVSFKTGPIEEERRWQFLAIGAILLGPLSAGSYGLFYAFHAEVPDLLTEAGRATLSSGTDVRGAFFEVSDLQVALQSFLTILAALSCLLFLIGRMSGRSEDGFHAWIGLSLVFATFSQLHYVAYPSVYSGTITTGDALRLLFYTLLLMGICGEYVRYQRSLRRLAALEERTRIARDMHDGVAQNLSFVVSTLGEALSDGAARGLEERLSRWREILTAAQDNLRDAVASLGPASSGEDLKGQVSLFCRDFARRYEMEVRFSFHGGALTLPPPKDREVLFLLTEALHNVRKHSDAARARVALRANRGHLVLTISSDGMLLHPPAQDAVPSNHSTHYGFASMTGRAKTLGGSLVITSRAERRTTIQLTIPR